ncbi:MAG: sigma-70 family RNA polymerase sigma factor [Proteobacteria bacterium]|nr:sigma-70 family RNA polymerase sigma factor [Pseudomonadota bacterium]
MNKRAEQASISQPARRAKPTPRDPARRNHDEGRSKRAPGPAVDEKELVKRAQSGDHDAFRVLFERYHRRAYSLAFGVLHNADDALDVVQDGFIKAHRYLDKFEGNSSFYTWLYRIIMNLSIDHIRKQKRARHVDFNDALGHSDGDERVGEDMLLPRILGQNPSKSLSRKRMRGQIGEALETLSDNHRAVLIMRELHGMTYEEMAEAMECSKGTIMSRLFHARKNMQKRLLELMGGQKDLEA